MRRLTRALFPILLSLAFGCQGELAAGSDSGRPRDAGASDAELSDARVLDSAAADSAAADSDVMDSGASDSAVVDSGAVDSAARDSGVRDSGTPTGSLMPPRGASSGGSGGGAADGASRTAAGGQGYLLRVPMSYRDGVPNGLMIVFSGTEGARTMMMNLQGAAPSLGLDDLIFAVLDGVETYDNGAAGAAVLDDVRAKYDVDNDRTFLLSESAGTRAGLELGLDLRQSYFAAYWANDVNATRAPSSSAASLGFSPHGNAGPGGDFVNAQSIVDGMRAQGYRRPSPAPYAGSGAGTHGDPNQFIAALRFFVGKSR